MADLIIQIGADGEKFKAELEAIQEKTEGLKDQLESAGTKASIAFAAVSAAILGAVHAYGEEEKIGLQTNAILQATGGIAKVSAAQVKELSESLSEVTSFSHESIQAGENILLTFTAISETVFPEATKAAVDLATRLGGDVPQAAQALGRALQDPIQGIQTLRREGILFSDVQKAQIKNFVETNQLAEAQKIIIDQVNSSVGGLAKTSAEGVEGSFNKLKNTFGDFIQQLGGEFAPTVKAAINDLTLFFRTLKENETAVKAVGVALSSVFVVSGVGAAIFGIVSAVTALSGAFASLAPILIAVSGPLGVAAATIAAVGVAVLGVSAAVSAGKDKFLDYDKTVAQTTITDAKRAEDALLSKEEKNKKHNEEVQRQEKEHRTLLQDIDIVSANEALLQLEGYNEQYLALQKQYYANELALDTEYNKTKRDIRLKIREELGAQLEEAYTQEIEANRKTQESFTTNEQKYHLKSLDQNTKAYKDAQKAAQKNYADEEKLQLNFLVQESNRENTERQQKFNDEKKFGEAYATLKALQRSQEFQALQSTFNNLQQLTQSHNETLKTIGKAAAVTNITIRTASAAIEAYEAFAFIPIVGPALGAAAAAAIIAFGAEQISTALAANEGGVYAGGIPGKDSIPALYTPGELVVPQQNFEEVINAVAAQRTGIPGSPGAPGVGGPNGNVAVQISFVGDAGRMLTAKQIQDSKLGLSRATA